MNAFQTLGLGLSALAAGLCAPIAAHAHTSTYQVSLSFNQVVYEASHPDWDTLFTGTFSFQLGIVGDFPCHFLDLALQGTRGVEFQGHPRFGGKGVADGAGVALFGLAAPVPHYNLARSGFSAAGQN